MIEQEPEYTCCLCGKYFKGYGNNAWPVGTGKCCNKCNEEKVLPARVIEIMKLENKNNGSSR
jgi:hypothetical protein